MDYLYLNNREISILFWFFIFFVFVFFQNKIRKTFLNILKIFFSKKILIPFFLMVTYVFLIIVLLNQYNIWNISILKDTLFWFLGTAVVMFFNSNQAQENEYFKKMIFNTFKMLSIVSILHFIINLYVFNLGVELILVPIILVISIMSAVASMNSKYASVKKKFDTLLIIIGLVILLIASINIVKNISNYITDTTIRSFLIPGLLTIIYLPFIYFLAIYSAYESLFVRLLFQIKNKKLIKFIKFKIFFSCGFNLKKINKISPEFINNFIKV